jgi:hypothetical protein
VVAVVVLWLARPRTSGLDPAWEAAAVDGTVLGGRALVSRDNTAIDLTTGKTIRLGSVPPGRQSLGDDRLIVLGDGRVDSVRLDATSRWTWKPDGAGKLTAVAAAKGWTVFRSCADSGGCSLVGVSPQGKPGWDLRMPGPPRGAEGLTSGTGALPVVGFAAAEGGTGAFVIDPVSGRTVLQPGTEAHVRDGVLSTRYESGGSCVTTTYASIDRPRVHVDDGSCPPDDAGWPEPSPRWSAAARETGFGLNPFSFGTRWEVRIVDAESREDAATLLSRERTRVLRLEDEAVVVRQGDRVVRYDLRPS